MLVELPAIAEQTMNSKQTIRVLAVDDEKNFVGL